MIFAGMLTFQLGFSQLSDEEYSYITADFKGILNLNVISNPQVEFSFSSIDEYSRGIVKYNAVRLQVDATVNWDLFAYASTDFWTQAEAYSKDGEADLPAEVLEIQAISPNLSSPQGGNFNDFTSIKGLSNSGVVGGVPDAGSTQFIAGMVGTGPDESYGAGSARSNPETHDFRVHYRVVPGLPTRFPNSTVPLGGKGFLQAGNYTIEVVFALVEDL